VNKVGTADLLLVSIAMLAATVSFATFGFYQFSEPVQTVSSNRFNFIFRHGANARNELNTFKGTYARNTGIETPVTIILSLSPEELDRIRRKMIEIDFFSYPSRFNESISSRDITGERTAYESYYILAEYNYGSKEVSWNDRYITKNERAAKLTELVTLIKGILESKPEYIALLRPR
jgi:hypothetical protein